MAQIGQNIGNIAAKHEAARAANAANNDKTQQATAQNTQQALENAGNAWEEFCTINSNDWGSMAGETWNDAVNVVGAGLNADSALVMQALTDAGAEIQEEFYNGIDTVAEGIETAGSVINDVGTFIGGGFDAMVNAFNEGGQEALDNAYGEQA